MRILGLDVGSKTIGVAISDPLGWTAQGITTIKRQSFTKDIGAIKKIYDEYGVDKIVVGLPKNMNGTIGETGEMVQDLCQRIKNEFSPELVLWDERLTTVAAERAMLEADLSRKKRKKIVDKIAATYILQGYLDRISNEKN